MPNKCFHQTPPDTCEASQQTKTETKRMCLPNVNNPIMSQHHSTQKDKYLQAGLLEHGALYKDCIRRTDGLKEE